MPLKAACGRLFFRPEYLPQAVAASSSQLTFSKNALYQGKHSGLSAGFSHKKKIFAYYFRVAQCHRRVRLKAAERRTPLGNGP